MAQPAAVQASPDGEIQFIATEAMVPGNFYVRGNRCVYIDGIQTYAIGDLTTGRTNGVFRCKKASALVLALDAVANFDPATGLIVATGSGIGPVGKVNSAVGAGVAEVLVELNR